MNFIFICSGSYKWTEKNELSQCEVNMEFKTNKFNTAITGYVRTTDISLSTNLKFDYQFDNLTAEYVRLELTFSDRSTKHYAKLAGDVKLESSAYRQINTVTRLNYTVSGQGIRPFILFILVLGGGID